MTFTFREVAQIAVWLINALDDYILITIGLTVGSWIMIQVYNAVRDMIG